MLRDYTSHLYNNRGSRMKTLLFTKQTAWKYSLLFLYKYQFQLEYELKESKHDTKLQKELEIVAMQIEYIEENHITDGYEQYKLFRKAEEEAAANLSTCRLLDEDIRRNWARISRLMKLDMEMKGGINHE